MLLVDDDVRFAGALETALRQRGYDVVRAPTAADALRAVPDRGVDIVLLDLGLPDRDGMTCAGNCAAAATCRSSR